MNVKFKGTGGEESGGEEGDGEEVYRRKGRYEPSVCIGTRTKA